MKNRFTGSGSFVEPGTIGTPVIKSFVSNGLSTIERQHDGIRFTGSRSKCTGINTTGICEIFRMQPDEANVYIKNNAILVEMNYENEEYKCIPC